MANSTIEAPAYRIGMVEYQIPADTDAHWFNYPSGMVWPVFIGAHITTKYGSVVDVNYPYSATDARNVYFGSIAYDTLRFRFTPHVAGNATTIQFYFAQV